jgi:hypothetical protein
LMPSQVSQYEELTDIASRNSQHVLRNIHQ